MAEKCSRAGQGWLLTELNKVKLASCPADSTIDAWSRFLAYQQARTGLERVESLLDLSVGIRCVHAEGARARGEAPTESEGSEFTEAATSAVAQHGTFNLIHPASGWKIDIIVKKDRDFSRREFDRRITAKLFGKQVSLASPEDTILSKLEWAKESMSERQIRDAAEIIDSLGERLDRAYLEDGIRELGLQRVFDRLQSPLR
jgi:hypothetical protein